MTQSPTIPNPLNDPYILTTITLVCIIAFLASYAYADKCAWIAYDAGRGPPTWAGYFQMLQYRLQCALRRIDLREHRPMSATTEPGYLSHEPLPHRSGPRPQLNHWILPQRHEEEPDVRDAQVMYRLHTVLKRYADANATLRYGLSGVEGRATPALHVLHALPSRPEDAHDPILKDEIAHVHLRESSLHVWLCAADAKEVVKKGWGERFPLGCLGMVHPGFCFVYAPTDLEEMAVVERIVGAGVGYVTGVKPRL